MLKTPSGRPDSIRSSPRRTAESGTFSEGLSTNVFPHVIATGNIQSGHHHREVKRRDPHADAQRVANGLAIDLSGDVGQSLPHEQAGNSAGEFDHLDSALNRGPCLRQGLAVLSRDERGELFGMSGQPFSKSEHHSRTDRQSESQPTPGTPRPRFGRRGQLPRPCKTGPSRSPCRWTDCTPARNDRSGWQPSGLRSETGRAFPRKREYAF